MECLIKSLGYGLYQVVTPTPSDVVLLASQIGNVLESWDDPEDPVFHFVVLDSGHPTSKMEVHVLSDPDVTVSARRTIAATPPGCVARSALASVAAACVKLVGEKNAPDLSV